MPPVGDALEVVAVRSDHVADGVAAELLSSRPRELPCNGRFGDDRERLHGLHVAALDQSLRRLARSQVDRVERLHERRQWLHRGAHDNRLAVRDAGFDATRTVGAAV